MPFLMAVLKLMLVIFQLAKARFVTGNVSQITESRMLIDVYKKAFSMLVRGHAARKRQSRLDSHSGSLHDDDGYKRKTD